MPPSGAGLATLRPVHRLLAIVLLALLPLQFSWAAVASYCEREAGVDAAHVCHHEHLHPANAVADDGCPEGAATGAGDVDCGHCHGHCTGLLGLPESLSGDLSTATPRTSADEAGSAHAPARPERPQWAPLA